MSSASRSNSLRVTSTGAPRLRHRARRRVEAHAADSSGVGSSRGRGGARRGAAQDRADAGGHLAGAEGLDDVVVGAQLEADHAVGLVAAGGEHDDRDLRVAADLAADVEAGAVGKHEVEEDEVGADARGRLDRARGRAGHLEMEPLAGQGLGEGLRDGRLVLDQEDRPPAGCHVHIVGGHRPYARRMRLRGARHRGGRRAHRGGAGRGSVVAATAPPAAVAAGVVAGLDAGAVVVVDVVVGAVVGAAAAVVVEPCWTVVPAPAGRCCPSRCWRCPSRCCSNGLRCSSRSSLSSRAAVAARAAVVGRPPRGRGPARGGGAGGRRRGRGPGGRAAAPSGVVVVVVGSSWSSGCGGRVARPVVRALASRSRRSRASRPRAARRSGRR